MSDKKKKKEGGSEKGGGGENSPISPPLDPRLIIAVKTTSGRLHLLASQRGTSPMEEVCFNKCINVTYIANFTYISRVSKQCCETKYSNHDTKVRCMQCCTVKLFPLKTLAFQLAFGKPKFH